MFKWTSEAWRDLREDKESFTKLLEKTGCLMTVDGSEDEKIQPQGYPGYQVFSPKDTLGIFLRLWYPGYPKD